MLLQFLLGTAVSVCNIAVHAMVMVAVIGAARIASESATLRQSLRLTAVMSATASVLMAAHLAEVLVWSFAYSLISIAPPGTDLVYFAFVNYTTLGYGDVTPLERWRLLGPMTAMNGVLLFGWSTAVIFEVLRRTLTASRREQEQREQEQCARRE
jgi:Ion channel